MMEPDGGASRAYTFRSYKKSGILVLDDLGVGRQTDGKLEWMQQLMDYRLGEMLPTVVTSNMSDAQLADIEPRLESRLTGGLVSLNMRGQDMRKFSKNP